MPIPIACPHCGATYTVADDLRFRKLLCKECDRPVVVKERRRRSPLRIAAGVVVLALALLPGATLAGLWWTGWLWEWVDWPALDQPGFGALAPEPGANDPAVTLHISGLARSGRWRNLSEDLKFL